MNRIERLGKIKKASFLAMIIGAIIAIASYFPYRYTDYELGKLDSIVLE